MKKAIRQFHRWLGIAFTLTVVANFAVRPWGEPPAWITYSPLAPLFLLMFSGLYLFTLPYLVRRGGASYPDGVRARSQAARPRR